ncbi:DedA family protein [Brevibacterium sp. 50QC2O2]|uniref:DedA family protein n=1 Tax=Brevibacterium TaxID=1696 RepID=UPI00211C9BDC|nr:MULTISPECIES: DedA family protein [unclassified Brevibacterium]MCQ9369601.1 DedA family protein [Brevibacterium sp. 91QC2O2]MCQ9386918.1 DedA family protein [Brevibacterium sp. 68QC2CO]MCQ9388585.1 DedA family protein [Brevibacterium sp. 50QC2O2]
MEMNAVAHWAVTLMERLGGPGAGLAIALENLFPPLPSEVILPLAGFTASRGSFTLPGVLFWTTLGSVVGALMLYGLGAWLGRERTRKLFGAIPLVKVEDVEKTEAWFDRHGPKAVFFGRMVPIFRSFISIPAGVTRMSLLRFTLLTTLGSAIWNTIFVCAGFYLGENWHVVEEYADVFQKIVIFAVLAFLVWFIGQRILRRKPKRSPRH